jgi:hypothetical protein
MPPKRSHEEFKDLLSKIQPNIIMLEEYVKASKRIRVMDELNIEYLASPIGLVGGAKPTIKSAINKTEAARLKLLNFDPNLSLVSEYIEDDIKITISKDGINYKAKLSDIIVGKCTFTIELAENKTELIRGKIELLHPELILMNDYIKGKNKLIVQDNLGINYYSTTSHLLSGKKPTMKTAVNKTEAFIIRAKFIHNGKYIYSVNDSYISNLSVFNITCPVHGSFSQKAMCHLAGQGCRKCSNKAAQGCFNSIVKYAPEQETYIYLMKCSDEFETFYKIGLTKRIQGRINTIPYKVTLIALSQGFAKDLFEVEQKYKSELLKLGLNYQPLRKFGGYTECFGGILT